MSEAVDIDPIISKLLEGGCLIITISHFLFYFWNGFSSFLLLLYGHNLVKVCCKKEGWKEAGIVCAIHAIAIFDFAMLNRQWKEGKKLWRKIKSDGEEEEEQRSSCVREFCA